MERNAEVVDLRERRIQAKLDLLDAILSDPDHHDRTAAVLDGALPFPDLEATVPDIQTALRLPQSYLDRASALVPAMRDDVRNIAFGGVSRTGVIRLAIGKGLAVIEAEYAEQIEQMMMAPPVSAAFRSQPEPADTAEPTEADAPNGSLGASLLRGWIATEGLSIRAAAARIGCSPGPVSNWTRAVNRPGPAQRKQLLAAAAIPVDSWDES